LLDDFERGELGGDWFGGTESYAIKDGRLWCEICNQAAFWSGPFEREQEVFATFSGFDAAAKEMNLILRGQESSTCEQIEIIYSPASLDVRVAYCVDGTWTDLEGVELLLQPGQQLGGRLHADDKLDVFVDGMLVRSYELGDFPHKIGRIGVSGLPGAQGIFWDDFGGGNCN
jgi:hypothetical protein